MSSKIASGLMAMLAAVALGAPQMVHAQDMAALAKNPRLFLEIASKAMKWQEPAEPMKIAGPIFFVGTKGLGVWLITTSAGHILVNTAMPSSGPMIEASIRKLGFKPEDIRLIVACHAHIDHVGGHAHMKRISGAKIALIDAETALADSGGKLDFHYHGVPEFEYEPFKTDLVLRDGDTLKLGEVALTARLMPGHSRGATTWVTNIVEDRLVRTVVFPDGSGVNPGYRVSRDPSYPGIEDDYRRTLHALENLKPDIWLAAHTETFDFEGKRARSAREGVKAWVDPEGYRRWVAGQRELFEAVVNAEQGVPAKGK
jgi:metallo-beta-lactamase class B